MADLIDLFPGKQGEQSDHEAPVRNQERDPGERWCRHLRVGLHHESRRVYCEGCSREVPAFDALKKLANEWERYKQHRDRARTDARRAQPDGSVAEVWSSLDESALEAERAENARREEALTECEKGIGSLLWVMNNRHNWADPRWDSLAEAAEDDARRALGACRSALSSSEGESDD